MRLLLPWLVSLSLTVVASIAPVCAAPVGHSPAASRPSTPSAETVLFGFPGGGVYGGYPYGGIVSDKNGDLFGTTSGGGPYGWGTVFELSRTASGYTYNILHNFQGNASDGGDPRASLLVQPNGSIFGTTVTGGASNLGTVFKLKPGPGGYVETVVYSFNGGATDGEYPFGGVIADKNGVLYGTTGYDGAFGYCVPNTDCGTVFKLTPNGRRYTEKILAKAFVMF